MPRCSKVAPRKSWSWQPDWDSRIWSQFLTSMVGRYLVMLTTLLELVRSVSQSIGLSILHGKLLRNVSQLPLTVEKSAKLDFERLMKDETRVHATKNPSEILRSRARISDWYPCPLLNLLRFDDQKKYISVDQIESCHWGTKVSDTENWIPQSRFQSDKYKK